MNIGGSNIGLARKLQEHLADEKGGKGAGISTAIVINGELIAACAAGTRGQDGTPVDIGDLYNIGSVSKIYCAAAIMKLVEMGKVDLDEPIIKYLPRFIMRDERYKDITVRMTLNHSSGLPGSNYRNAISDRWTGNNRVEEDYEYFSHAKLKANPGLFTIYCNDGFEVAAMIIEEVSGQSYIEFLRQFVATPAGALTTGIADIAIDTGRMMSCVGKKPEWLSAIGAGAIRTDLSDCARFGYLFIDSDGVINKEYLEEICKPQGVTFLKNDSYSPMYGLGWDTVEFRHPEVDLGNHALEKNGGTAQFESELIISPKYKLSAAISGTTDCDMNYLTLLCELIAIAMKELGIDVTTKPEAVPHQSLQAQPIPLDWFEKHRGVYYSKSNDNIYKLEYKDEKLVVLNYEGEGEWKIDSWYPEMQWDGEKFYADKLSVIFEEHDDKEYFIVKRDNKYFNPFAQKNGKYPPMSSGWQKRIGKKYLACNVSAFDRESISETAVFIDKAEDDGVILFIIPDDEHTIPAVSCGDDDTDMFLNIPHDGAENIYAPFMFNKDGVEYLRIRGYIYIDVDTVPQLKTGMVRSPKKEQNALFKTTAGTKLEYIKPNDVTVILFNDKLSMMYNSHDDELMHELCDGYIIFANDGPMDFVITVNRHSD